MKLILTYKGDKILDFPVSNELEYFRCLKKLERTLKPGAECFLYSNNKLYYRRKLGFPPIRVFNGFDGKFYDFEYFKRNACNFPLRTSLMFAAYVQDKDLYMVYGL